MEVPVEGVMVAALQTEEGRNKQTGEVIAAEGQIYMLVTERGSPAIKKIKCSLKMAAQLAADGIAIGKQVVSKKFIIDISEYNVNGRSGVSYKLVESYPQQRQSAPAPA